MKFQVPQFIDIEDKMFGQLSFKEFAYIAGGCGLSYILYRYIPSFLFALIFIIPVLGFAGLLAFYHPNNKPFIEMVQSALVFALGKKLYTWKKDKKPLQTKEIDFSNMSARNTTLNMPDLTENKLSNLSRSLEVQEKEEAVRNINDSLNLKI